MTVNEVLHEQFGSTWEKLGTVSMVCSADEELVREYITALTEKISNYDHVLPTFCDAAGCAQIEDWKRRLGNAMVSAAEKKDLWVPQPIKEELEDVSSTNLSVVLQNLLAHLLRLGVHIFLISEHFEQAVHWESDMTWGRKLFSREFKSNMALLPSSNFSAVLIADRPMDKITGYKPQSASSFANIFGGHTFFFEGTHLTSTCEPAAGQGNPWSNGDGPFFGRKDYLAELRDALFFSKTPRHISIYGMPKVGKTRLLKEVIKDPPDKVIPLLSSIADTVYFVLQCTVFDQSFWAKCSEPEELEPFFLAFRKMTHETDATKLFALLHTFLQKTTQLGYRTVLLLDEFDNIRIGQESAWTEEAYNAFVELLMDRSLNLACATASRRTVESLISHNKYRWRLNPFESWLLTGFNEEEMEECFQCLEDTGCPVPSGEELDRLMYRCGRNPYLLNHLMLTGYAKSGGTVSLDEIYQRCESDFAAHFGHVLTFMWQEETLQEHSFSHIVKCYFDPSPDYRDLQERFIGMGYLELLDPNSKFTWSGYRDKVVYLDTDRRYEDVKFADKLAPGSHRYTYITLSPLFISRFYTAKFPVAPGEADRGTVLDQVKDAKDLLTSLVHTIRDITAEELQQASCADCQYKAVCRQCGKGEMAGVFGADWNEKLLRNCIKAPGRSERYRGAVSFQKSSALGGAFITQALPDNSARRIWISSCADFLLSAFNRNAAERSQAPLLDPINLSSNGTLIRSFLPRFQNYFGCFRFFSSDPNKDFMPALKHLENARNEIAHYSRVGMTAVMMKDTAALCRYLLRSIHLWRNEGRVCPPSAPPKWRS